MSGISGARHVQFGMTQLRYPVLPASARSRMEL